MLTKRPFFLAIILAIFAVAPLVHAQPIGPPEPPYDLNEPLQPANGVLAPALEFETHDIDFGEVDEGDKVPISFPVKNTSDRTVKILQLNTGCGCTAAGNNPKEIAPGEETSIEVTYSTHGRRGAANRRMTLVTDDAGQPRYELRFTGEVISPIFWKDNLLDLGTLDAGEVSKRTTSLFVTLEENFTVKKINCQDERLSVEMVSQRPYVSGERKGTEFVFQVTVPDDFPITEFFTRVSMETEPEDVNIPMLNIKGRVEGDVVAEPRRLYATVPQGETSKAELVLKSRSQSPFKVTSIEPIEGMDVEFEVIDGDEPWTKKLVGTMSADANSRTRQGDVRLTIESDSGKTTQLDVRTIMVVRRIPMADNPRKIIERPTS